MTALDRRQFLQVTATVAGGLSIGIPWSRANDDTDVRTSAFLLLHADGTATITVPHTELGQGVLTSLAVLIAEELELPLDQVHAQHAVADASRYGNQTTSGSNSIRTRFLPMRRAGAAAREMLRAAAAGRWGVAVSECLPANGVISHPDTGRSFRYGDLLSDLADAPVPQDPPLKPARQFSLIGRTRPHLDITDLVTGRARYGLDTRPPESLFAAVARCPVFGGALGTSDSAAALRVPGVIKIVAVPAVPGNPGVAPGLAVIADNSWAALKGRDLLSIDWRMPAGALESDALITARLEELLAREPGDLLFTQGDPGSQLETAAADTIHSADYNAPFLAHATMEPMNCCAHVSNNRVELWAPTQSPNLAQSLVAAALGVDTAQVRLHVTRAGGGFGRRLNIDYAVEAALIARELEQPVKVIWSREDDMQHDFYRPRSAHRLVARVDNKGRPIAWRHHLSSPAIFAAFEFGSFSERPGFYEATGALDMPYGIPARDCGFSLLPSRVPRGWWRAVSTTHTVFAVESFIDELAHAAGTDPLAYRLDLIDELPADVPLRDPDFPFEPERMKGALMLAAGAADWGRKLPAGHAQGLACSWDHLTYAAQVVHVSIPAPGQLRIHKVTSAIDCGLVVNPGNVRAQVEGSVIQGLSAALGEQITLRDGRVFQQNFHDYPVMRLAQAPPAINVRIRPSNAAPTGAGEPALPPVAPALANAIFAATGTRLRSLPIDRAQLRAATG
ncbi:MAG: molybdopterin-dependent oxidoreductase [Gammaproteobacteria bacterium]|nr:molybdopterin-dependent oxidoreductase [Gammaproteobacteria bacterium]